MKKAIYLLITLLICASLCGCGAKVSENTTAQISQTATTQPTTAEPTEEATEETTTTSATTTSAVSSTAESTTKLTTVTAIFTTEKTTSEKTTKQKTTKPKTEKSTIKPTSTATTTEAKSEQIKCTVAIDCSSILDNMQDLKAGKEKYVPDSGVILSEYKVTLSEGSNVYLALDKACEENNIPIAAQKSIYGVYISGINYLYEKDCGSQSGWLYSVNGTQPNISASSYTLQNGDKVVFTYTCTY